MFRHYEQAAQTLDTNCKTSILFVRHDSSITIRDMTHLWLELQDIDTICETWLIYHYTRHDSSITGYELQDIDTICALRNYAIIPQCYPFVPFTPWRTCMYLLATLYICMYADVWYILQVAQTRLSRIVIDESCLTSRIVIDESCLCCLCNRLHKHGCALVRGPTLSSVTARSTVWLRSTRKVTYYIHMCIHAYTRIHMHECTLVVRRSGSDLQERWPTTWMHAVHMYIFMYSCIYFYSCVYECVYVYIHIYTYMYIYTCIYLYIWCIYMYDISTCVSMHACMNAR